MIARADWTPGGFAYLSGGAYPFSSGIAAAEGYALTRVSFRTPRPLAGGMAIAADFLAAQNRPPAAFAACELRSPAPIPNNRFVSFNEQYRQLLRAHDFGDDEAFPIARSNLAPQFDAPPTVTLTAFTYTMRTSDGAAAQDFLISGQPELSGDPPAIVAPGDISAAGLTQKATAVFDGLRGRVEALGARWSEHTAIQVYSVHSFDAVRDVLWANGLARRGITFFLAAPPVIGFDFEADVRAVTVERFI